MPRLRRPISTGRSITFQQVVGLCLAEREANRAFLATNSGQLAVVLEKGFAAGLHQARLRGLA